MELASDDFLVSLYFATLFSSAIKVPILNDQTKSAFACRFTNSLPRFKATYLIVIYLFQRVYMYNITYTVIVSD